MQPMIALAIVLSATVIAWIGYRIGRWHGRQASADDDEFFRNVSHEMIAAAYQAIADEKAARSVTCGHYDSAMQQVRELMVERDQARAACAHEQAERDQALLDLAEATKRIAVLQEDVEIALAARDAACAECDVAAAQWVVMAGERDVAVAERDALRRRLARPKARGGRRGQAAPRVDVGEAA